MPKKIRLIARLDVKDTNLVKGIQLAGLRKLGDPNEFAKDYYGDGMDELLDTLTSSGYTLCVATSKPRVFAERILDHFGIAPYFSFVGGTGLDGSLPTKADVIAHVLAGSNITDRGTALMIGDRKYDILGAKTVGIDSAGVLYGYGDRAELEAAGADYILPAIPDLEELLLE